MSKGLEESSCMSRVQSYQQEEPREESRKMSKWCRKLHHSFHLGYVKVLLLAVRGEFPKSLHFPSHFVWEVTIWGTSFPSVVQKLVGSHISYNFKTT
uniref:Serine/threonine-protein phosphatase 7 inactive homolog isoform X1 n=1 Tax=Rhizophora mucronata TaxID=61149 RepID=A0A2P2JIJ6_RHIMU